MNSPNNTVCIIFGCPGSGKSKLSSQLTSTIIISADKIEKLIYTYSKEEILQNYSKLNPKYEQKDFNNCEWKISRELVKDIVQLTLQHNNNQLIIVEDDFLLLSQRKAILHICQQYKAAYVEILLDPDLQILKERNINRDNTKQINEILLFNFYNKLERQILQNRIDITNLNLNEINAQIKMIAIQDQLDYDQKGEIQIKQKQDQIKNEQNVKHQTDLAIRSLISEFCKQQKYDPQYLCEKKKNQMKNLSDDVNQNVIEFLKSL